MDGFQQLENSKVQLMAQLKHLSDQMRAVAEVADQYHQIVATLPYVTQGVALPPLPVTVPTRKRKSQEGEIDFGRRSRRKRDPDMPKRPASAYLFYQNEVRGSMKQFHPFTPHHELLGMISQQWGKMTDEEKRPYEEKQRAAKVIYDQEMVDWNTKHGIETKPAAATVTVKKAPEPVQPVIKSNASTDDSEVEAEGEVEAELSEEDEPEVASEDVEDEEEEEPAPPPPPAKKTAAKPPSSKSQPTPSKATKAKKSKA